MTLPDEQRVEVTMRILMTSVACMGVSSLAFGQVLEKTLMHEDARRSYIMYVPSSYTADVPTPLVVNMHGLSSNARQQMNLVSVMNVVAERNRQAIGSGPHHSQCEVGIVTMDADEQGHFDLIVPNRQIGMIGIDPLLRVDLGIFRAIVRHGNDHDVGNFRRKPQERLSFGDPFRMPSPQIERPREDRRIRSRK